MIAMLTETYSPNGAKTMCNETRRLRNFYRATSVLVAVFLGSSLLPASTVSAQTRTHGERLDPATYGPQVIESMETVIERARLASENVRPKSTRRSPRSQFRIVRLPKKLTFKP